eukprot:TRINITY_DN3505_c0_g1_i2.p1 TRINITY_DN3505_c0_g1~~TRINITY_DN3505_c0_g1_i2.p1  ORF type:complete len:262 (-),score=27.75 TRINITY_DN3505_c0_g1_i2:340-1125(-)
MMILSIIFALFIVRIDCVIPECTFSEIKKDRAGCWCTSNGNQFGHLERGIGAGVEFCLSHDNSGEEESDTFLNFNGVWGVVSENVFCDPSRHNDEEFLTHGIASTNGCAKAHGFCDPDQDDRYCCRAKNCKECKHGDRCSECDEQHDLKDGKCILKEGETATTTTTMLATDVKGTTIVKPDVETTNKEKTTTTTTTTIGKKDVANTKNNNGQEEEENSIDPSFQNNDSILITLAVCLFVLGIFGCILAAVMTKKRKEIENR